MVDPHQPSYARPSGICSGGSSHDWARLFPRIELRIQRPSPGTIPTEQQVEAAVPRSMHLDAEQGLVTRDADTRQRHHGHPTSGADRLRVPLTRIEPQSRRMGTKVDTRAITFVGGDECGPGRGRNGDLRTAAFARATDHDHVAHGHDDALDERRNHVLLTRRRQLRLATGDKQCQRC